MDTAICFPDIYCKFGMEERTNRGISIELNENERVDDAKFKKYVMNSSIPLYPDALDIERRHVMIN